MPFALHTMDPGCPVVAIEETAEAAWEAADRMGLTGARALVLPCAFAIDAAAKAAEKLPETREQLSIALEDARVARVELREAEDEAKDAHGDLDDAESRAEEAESSLAEVKDCLRDGLSDVDDTAADDTATRAKIATSALRHAAKIAGVNVPATEAA